MAGRIQVLLRSEAPPAQFKLLETLRMLADGQGRELLVFTNISYTHPSPPTLPLKDKGYARVSVPLT